MITIKNIKYEEVYRCPKCRGRNFKLYGKPSPTLICKCSEIILQLNVKEKNPIVDNIVEKTKLEIGGIK